MRILNLLILFFMPLWVFGVEIEEGNGYILFRCPHYKLRFFKDKGTFDLQIRDKKGGFSSIHRPEGESPWFGYNGPKGEVRSSQNVPRKLEVRRTAEGFEVSLRVPLDEGGDFQGNFLITDYFLLVRSLINSREKPISILRLAPRFEVDIELFNRYAFSLPGGIVSGVVKELGRPGYAGVLGWGGPKSYSALDPSSPFFALYNPDAGIGFLFLYPFYQELWNGKHIFLQLWEGGINYLYAGWGEEKDLGREVLFAIAPLQAFSENEIGNTARKLTKEIETKVRKGEIKFPSLLKVMEMKERITKNWRIAEEFINRRISQPKGLEEFEVKVFELQMLYICSKIAYERRDYESALSYSDKMLKILGARKE